MNKILFMLISGLGNEIQQETNHVCSLLRKTGDPMKQRLEYGIPFLIQWNAPVSVSRHNIVSTSLNTCTSIKSYEYDKKLLYCIFSHFQDMLILIILRVYKLLLVAVAKLRLLHLPHFVNIFLLFHNSG